MSETSLLQKNARRRVDMFKREYGRGIVLLACHAALPVVLNTELLHLIRINFFLDTPEPLSYTEESDLLLSPICQEIGADLYEIEAEVRNILLQELVSEYGHERVREIAALLWQYTEQRFPWENHLRLKRAQQLTALNFLNPDKAKEWLAGAEESSGCPGSALQGWFVAMFEEIGRRDSLSRIIQNNLTKQPESEQGIQKQQERLQSLSQRIANRETDALNELINQFATKIQILIFRIIKDFGSMDDAEELASSVFMTVWQGIDKYDPSRGKFSTWIYTIVRYTALDFVRKIKRQKRVLMEYVELMDRGELTDEPDTFFQDIENLNEAISRLPTKKQKLITLYFYEDKSYAEIAKITGRTVGAIKRDIQRTVKNLLEIDKQQQLW